MDLGCALRSDGLPVQLNPLFPSPFFPLESEHSTFSKHGRSAENEDLGRLKAPRGDPMLGSATKAASFLHRPGSHSIFPDGAQMLSFSSWKPDAAALDNHWNLPFFSHRSSSSCASAHPTFGSSESSSLNMHGIGPPVFRGPFTPSQWLELEHQALIYKYIDAKMAVPSNLLTEIRTNISPSGFSSFTSGSSYRSSGAMGWGNFHLGFSGSADPEPGRCRRTDGKKWRCSRDAVADQKYCERHMNRGRHRSRKRVEGHNGHALKPAAPPITSSQSASAISSGGSSNNHATRNLQPSLTETSSQQLDGLPMNVLNKSGQMQSCRSLSMLTDFSQKYGGSSHLSKQQNPFDETSASVSLGLLSNDSSLLDDSRGNCSDSHSFIFCNSEMRDHHAKSHPFRHFIDDWPKNSSDAIDKMQSSKTELSISVPISSSDFSSSSSSPIRDKLSFSPLRLSSCETNRLNDGSQRGLSWIPISWEPASIGGPLGEVLTNTSSTTSKFLNRDLSSSSLNFMADGWSLRTRFESSPTGVLQESCFGGSLSSSTGSSPRVENHKVIERDDLLGSTFVNLSTTKPYH